jgi:hypothetical protein
MTGASDANGMSAFAGASTEQRCKGKYCTCRVFSVGRRAVQGAYGLSGWRAPAGSRPCPVARIWSQHPDAGGGVSPD